MASYEIFVWEEAHIKLLVNKGKIDEAINFAHAFAELFRTGWLQKDNKEEPTTIIELPGDPPIWSCTIFPPADYIR